MKRRGTKSSGPVPLSAAVPAPAPDRLVDGVPVKTYRGASLAEVAPLIRAELGDSAMILRQREGVTGGIAGFFAKRCVEIDVALVAPPAAGSGRIDISDGPAVGPGAAPLATPARSLAEAPAQSPAEPAEPQAAPAAPAAPAPFQPLAPPPVPPGTPVQPTVAFPSLPDPFAAPPAPAPLPTEEPAMRVTPPSIAQAQSIEAALRLEQERAQHLHDATADAGIEAPFDPGQAGVRPAPVPQHGPSFEEHLRTAGLIDPTGPPDPAHVLAPLHQALVRRGLPEQIASPIVDDTLCHRVALEPSTDVHDLLVAELARRIPTAPLVGRAGQAVAFVGSSGVGKTRAIARLAAAYGAAARIPVACVTLQDSGNDGLLAAALAPFGVAVHAAPDAPRALDRITALRRHSLVLVDTPGVSPGDRAAVDRLAATLQLLELDTVALCLPVTLAAPIARRVLRALRPLRPTALVATRADEVDLLGGVVAVAIDRRVPLAYISEGAGRGSIIGADAHRIAEGLAADADHLPPAPPAMPSGRTVPVPEIRRPLEADPAAQPSSPTVDLAAGAGHLAPPWITPSLRDRRR
jgi:flagellar biosynthesis GTPase FlhF